MRKGLSLKEKLRDLREERKLILTDVEKDTGISKSTLQRLETDSVDPRDPETQIGYQHIITLAKYYDVSTDYLLGFTENRKHRNVEIDKLRLSDEAVSELISGKLNTRLISEFLSHKDFPELLSAMEVYIDRKVLPQMNVINAIYRATESTIRENFDVEENDEVMTFLQQSVIDEDEYLRYRISERFNAVMKSLFDAHKKDPLPVEQMEAVNEIKEELKIYTDAKAATESEGYGRFVLFCKKLGLNGASLEQPEREALMKALEKSEMYRQQKGKKHGGKRR